MVYLRQIIKFDLFFVDYLIVLIMMLVLPNFTQAKYHIPTFDYSVTMSGGATNKLQKRCLTSYEIFAKVFLYQHFRLKNKSRSRPVAGRRNCRPSYLPLSVSSLLSSSEILCYFGMLICDAVYHE